MRAAGVGRAGIAGVALLVAVAVCVEVARERLEGSDALRRGLELEISSQLGVQLEVRDLSVSFWPASIRLSAPVLALPTRGRLTLGEVEIAVDPVSLLEGRARLRALWLRGPATLRTGELELEGELWLELGPAEAPRVWSLAAKGSVTSGGRFSLRGGLTTAGDFEGEVELTDLESQPFGPLLQSAAGEPTALAGRYSGTLAVFRETGSARLRLASLEASLDVPPLHLHGPVELDALFPVAEASGEAGGEFRVDASHARVVYEGGPARGSAGGGSLVGRVLRDPGGGFRLEDVGLRVRRFRGQLDERTDTAHAR